jgi:beta-lactamase class A
VVGAGALAFIWIWLANPFAINGPPGAPASREQRSQNAASGPVLKMADVAPPGDTSIAAGGGSGLSRAQTQDQATTRQPTLRHWDTGASTIISDAVLVSRLDQALAGVDGQVSIAVKELGSGRGAALDGDRELPAASLYKLPVLYAVFDAGLAMGEALPITDEARTYDTGTLELGVGETLTVAEALERMVTLSDNTSAVMLGSRVGGARINANLGGLGMDNTHYSLDRMTTSALDMLHLLDLMARGKAVSPAASADMVHLLLRQRVNDRLPRLLSDDVQVAHKTGNLPGTVNDVGILYGRSTTIAIAALISDTTDEAAAATGIARAALAAYAYLDDQPADARRPTMPPSPARPVPPVWREPRPVPTATPAPEQTPSVDAGVVEGAAAPTASVQPVVAPGLTPTLGPPPVAPATSVATSAPLQPTATATPARPAATATPVPPARTPTARPATPVPNRR